MSQLMQQQRSAFALRKVMAILESDPSVHSEFRSYSHALPAMIHVNGLGQAVAFCKSGGQGSNARAVAYQRLYELLEEWLCGNAVEAPSHQPYSAFDGPTPLLTGITQSDMQLYRHAQAEAQLLMDWVKKFAKAFLFTEVEQDGEEE